MLHNINYNIYSSHLNVFFVPQLCTSINYMFMNINFAVQIHLLTTEGLLFVCCSQNYAHSKSIFPVSNSDLDRFVWCSYYKEIIAAQKFNTTWQNILKLHVFYIHFYSFADLVARQKWHEGYHSFLWTILIRVGHHVTLTSMSLTWVWRNFEVHAKILLINT